MVLLAALSAATRQDRPAKKRLRSELAPVAESDGEHGDLAPSVADAYAALVSTGGSKCFSQQSVPDAALQGATACTTGVSQGRCIIFHQLHSAVIDTSV